MKDLSELVFEATKIWNDEIGGSLEYKVAQMAYDSGKEEIKETILYWISQNLTYEDDLVDFIKKL